MNTLLLGVVGSTAYGLAGPDSDVDRLGMYAAPTIEFHGLHPPLGREATIVQHNPDVTMHEAGKFVALCLKANPTVMELLWLNGYEIRSRLGQDLIDIRGAFLSATAVRKAYFGYAKAQFDRLSDTGLFASKQRSKVAKHARHMLRLLHHGLQLYSTGELTIKLEDAQSYIDFGDQVAIDPSTAKPMMEVMEARFASATSPLPEKPDEALVESWLHDVRGAYLYYDYEEKVVQSHDTR